jgi:hypothetical protein
MLCHASAVKKNTHPTPAIERWFLLNYFCGGFGGLSINRLQLLPGADAWHAQSEFDMFTAQ